MQMTIGEFTLHAISLLICLKVIYWRETDWAGLYAINVPSLKFLLLKSFSSLKHLSVHSFRDWPLLSWNGHKVVVRLNKDYESYVFPSGLFVSTVSAASSEKRSTWCIKRRVPNVPTTRKEPPRPMVQIEHNASRRQWESVAQEGLHVVTARWSLSRRHSKDSEPLRRQWQGEGGDRSDLQQGKNNEIGNGSACFKDFLCYFVNF